jgi:GMP synthase-like glutamine amidotransferase
MNIVILQHVPFETGGTILDWSDATGATVRTVHLYEDPSFPPLDDIDLLVVMGGPMSANDDSRIPWMKQELEFLHVAATRGVKILGVCLGAQLLARVLGARVYPGEHREIGWHPISPARDFSGSLFDLREAEPVPDRVLHWHGETFDLPSGARHLFSSTACEQQAFQYESHILGLQFHMEMTPRVLEEVARNCEQDLEPGRYVQERSQLLRPDQPYDPCRQFLSQVLSEWIEGAAPRIVPEFRELEAAGNAAPFSLK